MRRVCRAWRDAATLDLVQQASLTRPLPVSRNTRARVLAGVNASWWSRHRTQLTGLSKLDLLAPLDQAPVSVLTELRWSAQPVPLRGALHLGALLDLRHLRILRLYLMWGSPVGPVDWRLLPNVIELQFAAHFADLRSLTAACLPRVQTLQIEGSHYTLLPDFRQFTSLQRLCLKGHWISHQGAPAAPFLSSGVRTEVYSGNTSLLQQVLQQCRHVDLYLTRVLYGDAAALWACLHDELTARAHTASWTLDVVADQALRPVWPSLPGVTWVRRQEVYRRISLKWQVMLWD